MEVSNLNLGVRYRCGRSVASHSDRRTAENHEAACREGSPWKTTRLAGRKMVPSLPRSAGRSSAHCAEPEAPGLPQSAMQDHFNHFEEGAMRSVVLRDMAFTPSRDKLLTECLTLAGEDMGESVVGARAQALRIFDLLDEQGNGSSLPSHSSNCNLT